MDMCHRRASRIHQFCGVTAIIVRGLLQSALLALIFSTPAYRPRACLGLPQFCRKPPIPTASSIRPRRVTSVEARVIVAYARRRFAMRVLLLSAVYNEANFHLNASHPAPLYEPSIGSLQLSSSLVLQPFTSRVLHSDPIYTSRV